MIYGHPLIRMWNIRLGSQAQSKVSNIAVQVFLGHSSFLADWSRLLGLQSLGSSLNLPRPDELFLLDCPLPCLTPEDWEEKENRNECAALSQAPRPAMPAHTIADPVEGSQDRNVSTESTQRLPAAERCYWMVASRKLRRKYGIPLAATLPDGVPLPPIKDHSTCLTCLATSPLSLPPVQIVPRLWPPQSHSDWVVPM
jgi:hypothetical protein